MRDSGERFAPLAVQRPLPLRHLNKKYQFSTRTSSTRLEAPKSIHIDKRIVGQQYAGDGIPSIGF
jgi:hypothetical protein